MKNHFNTQEQAEIYAKKKSKKDLQNFTKKIITKAMIKGEVVLYNICTEVKKYTLKETKDTYKHFAYIGIGYIYSINGVVAGKGYEKDMYYFFKKKFMKQFTKITKNKTTTYFDSDKKITEIQFYKLQKEAVYKLGLSFYSKTITTHKVTGKETEIITYK